MTTRSNDICNKNQCSAGMSTRTPIDLVDSHFDASGPSYGNSSQHIPYISQDFSTGGKMPLHGPRRVVKLGPLFHGDFHTNKAKIYVSNSELRNYKAICHLVSSQYSK